MITESLDGFVASGFLTREDPLSSMVIGSGDGAGAGDDFCADPPPGAFGGVLGAVEVESVEVPPGAVLGFGLAGRL